MFINFLQIADGIFYMILVSAILLLTAGFVWHQLKSKNTVMNIGIQAIKARKEKNKNKVMELFDNKKEITNDDVQGLLKVSHATAFRYLDELEKERKIKKYGDTGRGVFYTK